MVYGIVVAGGKGTRIGYRKQYALLAGVPVWQRSVEALMAGGVEELWLVVPEEDVSALRAELLGERRQHLRDCLRVVGGGSTRFQSVQNGLKAILQGPSLQQGDLVAIHDAARPFVLPADVARTIEQARVCGGSILAQPCVDTMKQVNEQNIVRTVPRDNLWHAQTPQVFAAQRLKTAYLEHVPGAAVTDDASLFEELGFPVQVVASNGFNGKITTAADMDLAQWMAQQRWGE